MLLITFSINAQVVLNGDFEDWTAGSPDSWVLDNQGGDVTFSEETTIISSGASALKILLNTNGGSYDGHLTTQVTGIVAGTEYNVNIECISDITTLDIRYWDTRWYDVDGTQVGTDIDENMYNVSDTWSNYGFTATAPVDAVRLEVKIRFYGDDNIGSYVILDNFTVTDNSIVTGGGATCAEAIAVTVGTHHAIHTATDDYDQWYVFTATVDGTITVENCTSGFGGDTYLQIIENNCGGANWDDADDVCGILETLTFDVTTGEVYYIAWADWETDAPGEYDWTLTETETTFDMTSYVDATGVTQPTGIAIPSTNWDAVTPTLTPVFQFNIADAGTADGLPTEVTEIRIKAGANNTANWLEDIGGGILYKEGVGYLTITTEPDVGADFVTFYIDDAELDIADGGSELITLHIFPDETVADNVIIECMIDADAHGFVADAAGSTFAPDFVTDVVGSQFTIDVTATQFSFITQPSNVVVDAIITPAIDVAATDVNANIDIDYVASDIQVLFNGTGGIIGTTTQTPVNGIVTFDDLALDTEQIDVTLTAFGGTLSNGLSETFDVTPPASYDLLISEVTDPTNYEGRFVEIYNPTGSEVDFGTSTWYLAKQSNGGSWTDVQLTGTIPAGGTYVVGISNFNATYGFDPDLESGIPNGNGDDGYFLYAEGNQATGTLIDAYGEIDVDGSGELWEYENSIAVRNADITTPRIDWTDSEWTITAGDHTIATPGVHPNPTISEPVIENILIAPTNPTSSETVMVSADITDDVLIASAILSWGLVSGTYDQGTIDMFEGIAPNYVTDAAISAQTNGTIVYYIITATDNDANTTTTTEQSYTVFDMPTETLFISEYIEGSGNSKAIEIYNPTDVAVDLQDYRIAYANNGGDWSAWHTYSETTTIAPGEVWVLAADEADPIILAQADEVFAYPSVVHFNGDDAVALEMTTDGGSSWNIVDIIGDPLNDPGDGWDVAETLEATANHTLVRKYPEIVTGNNDWASSAGTTLENSEWTVFGQDEFTHIGWHGEESTDPTLVITAPIDGSTLYTSTVTVVCEVTNFDVAETGGDGYIVFAINGDAGIDSYTTTFTLYDLSSGVYTLTTTLVDNSGIPIEPTVTHTINFNIGIIQTLTINDIQYTEEPGGENTYPSIYNGQIVQTTGIVTAIHEPVEGIVDRYYIQDGEGAWNGVFVYNNDYTPAVGDDVTITGLVVEYNGLTELTNITDFAVNSSGNPLAAPVVITTVEGNDEQYEGVLISVLGVECTNPDLGYGMWEINDGSGAFVVDDDFYTYTPTISLNYNVTGVGHFSFDEYKIIPRIEEDIEVIMSVSDISTEIRIYPNPVSEVLNINSENVEQIIIYNSLGQVIENINYVENQTEINVSTWENGIYLIKMTTTQGVITETIIKQ